MPEKGLGVFPCEQHACRPGVKDRAIRGIDKVLVYLKSRLGGRGGPAEPSCACAGTRISAEACSCERVLNIAHSGMTVMLHRHLCMRIQRNECQWVLVREFKGEKRLLVSHIDHWNNMMSTYL